MGKTPLVMDKLSQKNYARMVGNNDKQGKDEAKFVKGEEA